MPPKGELETIYGGPWGGVDYSRPYNTLDPQFLAPGSVNTSQMNGWLTSSPWVGNIPYQLAFESNEYIIGNFAMSPIPLYFFEGIPQTMIVTNKAVYISATPSLTGPNLNPPTITKTYTWLVADLEDRYMQLSETIAFVQVNNTIYFTGLMLNGIYSFNISTGVFAVATTYVSAAKLIELAGYLVAAECRFPTGGGTGTSVLPTVAWSGPGEYAGSGGTDPWNPVNQLGGGFNELADVPDQITGLAGIGRSALIFRNFGVSQMDPNPGTSNSGLQPFTFYHLWSSQTGVGALPGTVAQFGQQVQFLSSDNVYSISIGAGLVAVGQRMIPKILADYTAILLQGGVTSTNLFDKKPSSWFYASIVILDGQQHYLLTLNAYTVADAGSSTNAVPTCKVYDYNINENAWHLWDLQQYVNIEGNAPFFFFSCPIISAQEISFLPAVGGTREINVANIHILTGAITFYQSTGDPLPGGTVFQIVPWNYDINAGFPTPFQAAVYQPFALPVTNITLRAEIISLGHKISTRRLRVQADNAPIPNAVSPAQQQATVTFTGMLAGNVQSAPLGAVNAQGQIINPFMQGNYPQQGLPIQTYYADLVLTDEMVQPSIASVIQNGEIPWQSLAAFRIATISLILIDATGTTQ